ncbi:hypothetical protein AB0J80_28355 [Actinoplanes sp. NPDC049548]|uniref:hypothetical protein n=1 Tax=Actinoplanes sp. NPDC049548 TaxID=3155152 RepID=UPI0034366D94
MRGGSLATGMMALVASLWPVAVPAEAAGPPMDDGTVASATAAYRAAYPQMSESAARTAFDQQLPRKQVYRAAEDTGAFGGSWFDAPSGVLHVAVTAASAAPSVERVADRLGVSLRVHLVTRSHAALQRQAEAVRTGGDALSRAAAGHVGIDVAANQVVVAVPRTARASLGAVPAGVRIVDATTRASDPDSACTSRLTCDASLRAGTMLRHYGLPICSAGFTARTPGNQRYVYTAGHCDIGPGRWSTGARWIGPMTSSVRRGPVDAGIIRVDNPSYADDRGGEIYFENADHTVALNDAAPTMAYLQQGDVVCLAANAAQVNGPNLCGVIGSVSDPAESGMVRVDGVDACTGDSGGGWYWLASTTYRVAYGLHSDSEPGCHGDSGGSRSWFSPIPEVAAVWGLTIETRMALTR